MYCRIIVDIADTLNQLQVVWCKIGIDNDELIKGCKLKPLLNILLSLALLSYPNITIHI